MLPYKNLDDFIKKIGQIKQDATIENFVRSLCSNYLKKCPIDLLILIARTIHTYRIEEMKLETRVN